RRCAAEHYRAGGGGAAGWIACADDPAEHARRLVAALLVRKADRAAARQPHRGRRQLRESRHPLRGLQRDWVDAEAGGGHAATEACPQRGAGETKTHGTMRIGELLNW